MVVLDEWQRLGRRVAAVVAPAASRSRPWPLLRTASPRQKFESRLRRHGVPVFEVGRTDDWGALEEGLRPLEADILVSFGFPKLVPEDVLALFPQGGVNIHPALLPHYRGPKPIERLLIDDTWRDHGGLTLHAMSSRYDEGDIIATVTFDEPAWDSPQTLSDTTVRALDALLGEVIDLYARGRVRTRRQDPEPTSWAVLDAGGVIVTPEWTARRLERVCAFVANQTHVHASVNGRPFRLAGPVALLGPPTGAPPAVTPLRITFDLADARVTCARYGRIRRRLAGFRRNPQPISPLTSIRCVYDLIERPADTAGPVIP